MFAQAPLKLKSFWRVAAAATLFTLVAGANPAPSLAANLTALGQGGCAQVSGTGSTQLAVRVNPSTNATIIRRISDGTKVYITGKPLVFGGYTWWPHSGGGWSAGAYLVESSCIPLAPYDVAHQLDQQVLLNNGSWVQARYLTGGTPVKYLDSTYGKPGQLQLAGPVTSHSGMRSSDLYRAVIQQFGVGNNPRYTPQSGWTFCNTFAGDVMRAMGTPLPTKSSSDQATKGATDLYNWLSAGNDGWVQTTSLSTILQYVNAGKPALAADAGHIAVIRPGQSPTVLADLRIAQAGANNINDIRLGNAGYGSTFNPKFFVHP